jgi:putative cardiolipin synthase
MKKLFITGMILSSIFTGSTYADEPKLDSSGLLSSTIPYPFYDVQKISEGKQNDLMVLNSGIASLEKRLEIIEKATSTIEVEYFIYSTDDSSRLITQALVKAAKRGVKVRMLIDKSSAIFVFDEWYAKALSEVKENGGSIELRYYNAASLWRISSINFRNHRKLITVDDKFAITGGRNIEDDYYDLSEEFNFLDRDVFISGDMVLTLRDSFDEFFKSKITERPELPQRPQKLVKKKVKRAGGRITKTIQVDNSEAVKEYDEKMNGIVNFITENSEDQKLRSKVRDLGLAVLSKKQLHSCPELTYSTDAPGADLWSGGNYWMRDITGYSDKYRNLRKTLFDKVSAANKKVIISSPYMINNDYSSELMESMVKNGVDIDIYTNSLASTDAVYVAANLYIYAEKWANMGINVFIHDGEYLEEGAGVISKGVETAMWGTHSKTQVYESEDYTEVMIGTYNVDNRSNHYNTEMAIFCKGSEAISNDVKNSIAHRVRNSYQIHGDGTATNKNNESVSVFGANEENEGLMKKITAPSWLLKFLL